MLSKEFEKLLLTRLQPILQTQNIIPDHQVGFRRQHATIEQIHRVVHTILEAYEKGQYCTAAFLDISQAFDKVWHQGLLCKLHTNFPTNMYDILRSYLHQRRFMIRYRGAHSPLRPVSSGVPHGSVLGPLLYLIYTADLTTSPDAITATFPDDTAVLATHDDPEIAVRKLQAALSDIQQWLAKWRLKANELISSTPHLRSKDPHAHRSNLMGRI